MSIKKQIILTFGIFAVIVSILIGSIYYVIYNKNYNDMLYAQMDERASVSSQQMSDIIRQMQQAYQVLLSDQDTLQAIQMLAKYSGKSDSYASTYFSTSYTTIRTCVNSYFVNENFYRLIYFNENGDVIAGENTPGDSVKSSVTYEDLEWLYLVSAGKQTVIGCHVDDWGRAGTVVLSLVRGLVGTNMGYIEVQWSKDDLDTYLDPGSEDYSVLFYNLQGNLLYSYGDLAEEVDYFSYIEESDFENVHVMVYEQETSSGMHVLQDGIVLATHLDSDNGIVTVIATTTDVSQRMLAVIPVLALIVFSFLAAGLTYVLISSHRIAQPILTLRGIMEGTNLDNLNKQTLPEKTDMNLGEEMEALYESYFHVLERLDTSIEKEKRLSLLQLEAQFGLLQAQVNPHFLYNILNVISLKGIMANDESICEICAALSRMLRYSTNTKEETGTILEEEQYLRTYLQLMKFRFEDRLEYEITIPEEFKQIVIPKVTLEQIVENCFQHGYDGVADTICITVTGWSEGNEWRVCVRDNGRGFSEEKIAELYERMAEIRRRLSEDRQFIPMEIGGMGLVNVYARLYLLLGDSLVFAMETTENGAMVTVGAVLEETTGESDKNKTNREVALTAESYSPEKNSPGGVEDVSSISG